MSGPALCQLCDEPILAGEPLAPTRFNGKLVHHECGFRAVVGGANHIRGRCMCFGGTEPSDPPGLSKRAAARAAYSVAQTEERVHAMARVLTTEAGFPWTDPRTGETHLPPTRH